MKTVKKMESKELVMHSAEEAMKRANALQELVSIYNQIDERMKWDCMTIRCDDTGNAELDENGERIYDAPAEGEYGYERYKVWKMVMDAIANLVIDQTFSL